VWRAAEVPGPKCLPPHEALVEGAPRSKGGATPMPRMEMSDHEQPHGRRRRKLPAAPWGLRVGAAHGGPHLRTCSGAPWQGGRGEPGPLCGTPAGVPRGEPAREGPAQCWSVPGRCPWADGRGLALAGSGSLGRVTKERSLVLPSLTFKEQLFTVDSNDVPPPARTAHQGYTRQVPRPVTVPAPRRAPSL